MLTIIALLLAYAGFAALCAVAGRSIKLVWRTPPKKEWVLGLRALGFLLLAVSWIPCYYAWLGWTAHWSMATVAWWCLMSTAGLILVWPFTYRPRASVMAGMPALCLAIILAIVQLI